MGSALITVRSDLYEDNPELITNGVIFYFFIFAIIIFSIIGIGIIYKRKRNHTNEIEKRLCKNSVLKSSDINRTHILFDATIVSYEQNAISRDLDFFSIRKILSTRITSVNICAELIVKPTKSAIKHVFPSIEERKLICYCDDSYSHFMQIGSFGFRASNGANQVHSFFPRNPRYGSTHTEVLAAYFAVQYALRQHYNTVVIYTDNSKVEQLLKRPKTKDMINYHKACQIFNHFRKQQGNNTIQVIRVRGHTSKYEQQNCTNKREFAKTDESVRKKTRQYSKRWWITFEQPCYNYYYSWQGSYLYSYNKWNITL